jgi:methyltransferase (TIGR00027 family)
MRHRLLALSRSLLRRPRRITHALGVESRSPSRTAVLTAVARALHAEEPSPVLSDQLALALAGKDADALIATLRAELPEQALLEFARWVAVRARVPEDLVERAAAEGVPQYVILGAGLDSFAYRRGDLLDWLRVFEVDHPGSQEWKRRRLEELEIGTPPNLVFAPVDFEHQTLRDCLETAGFDFGAPAIFSWIGVTMYLTLDAIRSTLATVVSCPASTQIALTYNLPRTELTGIALQTSKTVARITEAMGEPIITRLTPAEAEQLLRESGFTDVAHIGSDEARDLYFADRPDVRFFGIQRLVIGRVAT